MSGFVLPSDADPAPATETPVGPGAPAPFVLPSDADDAASASAPVSTMSDVAKAVPSGLAVGTAAAAGTPGDLLDLAGNAAEYGLQRLAKWSGLAPDTAQPQSYTDIAASNRALTKGTDILPRSGDILQAAHDDAGFTPYQPKTLPGQFLGKAAEFAPSVFAGPGGLGSKLAMTAGSAAGDMGAGALFDGTPYETAAHVAGSLAGGTASALTIHGASKLLPAWSDAAAKAQAAGLILDAAHDPAALRANVAVDAGSGELVPGSMPTSFQKYGDVGLGDVERAVNVRDPQKFVSNPYGTGTQEQNAAQVAAMQGVQPGGDAMSVPGLFLRQKQALEDAHDAMSGIATADAQDQFDRLGGTATPAQTGRDIKDAVDPQVSATRQDIADKVDAIGGQGQPADYGATIKGDLDPLYRSTQAGAAGQAAALGGADRADVYGAGLRAQAADAMGQANAKLGDLWDALPGDSAMTLAPLKQFSANLYGRLGPAAQAGVTPAENAIADALKQYGPTVPFSEGRQIDSLITSSMRQELKANGRTPAYARMVQMKGAFEDALHSSLSDHAAGDDAAVAAGAMDPSQTIGAKIQAASGSGGVPGAPSAAFTPAGTKIGTDYGVLDLGDITASHAPDGTPNPAFPAELQPRDRSRPASVAQVSDMAANLQPERLGHSTSTTDGAPIVGPDGVVESGNGRVMALTRAYKANGPQAAAYRSWLEGQGYDVSGMDRPALVRVRNTPLSDADRIALTQESNAPTVLTQSATERAAGDAGRISDGLLSAYRGGDVASAENRPFVRGFLRDATEPNERGALAGPDGALSVEGGQRVRNALLHAGYGDTRLVSSLAETGDPDIAAFGRALGDNAGAMAQLRRGVEAGEVHPGADLSGPAVEAARVVQRARSTGQPIRSIVDQADAFSPMSREARSLLQAGYGDDLSGRFSRGRMNAVLSDALHEAKQQGSGARLFGKPLGAGELIDGARGRYAAREGAEAGLSRPGPGDVAAPTVDASPFDRTVSPDVARSLGTGPGRGAMQEDAAGDTWLLHKVDQDPATGQRTTRWTNLGPREGLSDAIEGLRSQANVDDASPLGVASRTMMEVYRRMGVGDTPTFSVDPENYEKLTFTGRMSSGFRSGESGDIFLQRHDSAVDRLKTAIHEGAHAAFDGVVRSDPEVAANVKALQDHANAPAFADLRRQFGDGDGSRSVAYGTGFRGEFLTEAFSNPHMQEYLSRIPAPPDLVKRLGLGSVSATPLRTAWDAFKATLAKAFGLAPTPESMSMLEATLGYGGKLSERVAGRGAGGEGPAFSMRGGAWDRSILPDTPPAGPPLSQGALDDLAAARQATKDFHDTFRKGVGGDILRSDGTSGSYRLPDAGVGAKVFPKGPAGFQAVRAYERMVGDSADAAGLLHNYAASTLRKEALRPDGTLDPVGYRRWTNLYGDAIRALPADVRTRFDTAGHAAEALDRFGRFTPETAASLVPDQFFRPGVTGADGVEHLRSLVGADRADAVLGDYAASSLRRAAGRPDGTIDPGRFATWRRNHDGALNALGDEVAQRFDTAASAGVTMKRFGRYSPDIAPANVPELFFAPGKAGREGVDHLRDLVGDHAADTILSDHIAGQLKAKASTPDGMLDPVQFRRFMAAHEPAMSAFPQLAGRFSDAAKATQTVADVAAGRAAALKNLQTGAAGKFLGLSDPTEVRDAVGRMIEANNVTGLRGLMRQAAADPAALEGVRRAALDHMLRRGISEGTEAGASGVHQVNRGTFQNVLGKNRNALGEVFDPEQMKALDALSADMTRQKRTENALKMKGSPNTAADAIRAMKFEPKDHGNLLREVAEGAIGGEELGGEKGALTGAALAVVNRIRSATADAAMRNTYAHVERAVLDPDYLKTLLMSAPKNAGTGSHRTLATRLARYSMFNTPQADAASQDDRRATR